MNAQEIYRRLLLAGAAGVALAASSAVAQDTDGQTSGETSAAAGATPSDDSNDIVVTATRRDSTVQSAPINISALTGDQIQSRGLTDIRALTQLTPGIYTPTTGPRSASLIVIRGLNADPLGTTDYKNSGGGTVATYVGEVPLYIDLRPFDMQRVEFLAGPQGTLYGAGTLAGAIRYIPNRPQFDRISGDVRGEVYGYSHGNAPSESLGATINVPLSDNFAFRGSIDWLNDTGFVDQPFVVRTPGVSDPDPDFNDPQAVSANLKRVRGVNSNDTLAARAALRWQPSDGFDANLTYYYQQSKSNGRQASGRDLSNIPYDIDDYDHAKRVLEPNRRTNHLLALELSADLGFAQLTSSTGRSWYRDRGSRDQSDLLINLDIGYEAFPNFTAFTAERGVEDRFVQELRLVSKNDGPFSWIFGGFYSRAKTSQESAEYTPGYSEYLFGLGQAVQTRPDSLEYYDIIKSKMTETAAYGELSYELTPAWQITLGGRYYNYRLRTQQATDLPLYNTIVGATGPDALTLNFLPGGQKDNGFLFKINSSYKFSPTALVYATFSQGYRIGNSNGVGACPTPLPTNPIVCGLPNELAYRPDTTNNFEIGAKTQWFDRRLTLNVAAYYIKWQDPQVASVTKNGFQGITINGGGAETKGVEILLAGQVSEHLSLRANYAYTDPELTSLTANLVQSLSSPTGFEDGQPGDRLPGSPHHTGSIGADFNYPLPSGLSIKASYTATGQSNVLTKTGGRGNAYVIPGFVRHDASVAIAGDSWSLTAYVNNIFDKYSESGASYYSPDYTRTLRDAANGPVYVRSFFTYVLPPRQFGLRFNRSF